MSLLRVDQRSPEWHAARAGKITASLAAACLGLDPYRGPLAAYREIKGLHKPRENHHMAWGTEHEGKAREEYEAETGRLVEETGLWIHDEYPWLAASPDGLVGDKGLVEIKCPGTFPEAIPVPHLIQMMMQIACTGMVWCDYWAWSPNSHYLERFEPTQDMIQETIDGLKKFYATYILPGVEPPRRRAKKEATK